MKKSQILALLILLATGHGMDAVGGLLRVFEIEKLGKLYEIHHKNWYGMCEGDSQFKCPSPFDDLIFEDNGEIQSRFSYQEWIHHKDKNGQTLLIKAIHTNDILIANSIRRAEQLIGLGADVNQKDESGSAPLHRAVREDNTYEIVQLLLDAGADINLQGGRCGDTPLHVAARCYQNQAIQLLLDAGADVNQQNNDGNTPLHYAVRNHSFEVRNHSAEAIRNHTVEAIQLLLAAGADPRIKNRTSRIINQTNNCCSIS